MNLKALRFLKITNSKSLTLSILLSVVFLNGPAAYSASSCRQLFSTAMTGPVFQSKATLHFGLKANFSWIAKKSDFQFDGENRELKKFFAPSELEINGTKTLVEVRGNGSSSAYHEEASFRKLKVRLNSVSTANSEFQGVKDFYINTHMQNNPQTKYSPLGRLVDGNSPFREALVYDLAQVFQLETGGYRRALITYEDSISKQKFTKQALLIESHGSVAMRNGFKQLDAGEFLNQVATSPRATFEALKVHLFQALIGNEDFGYDIKRKSSPTTKFQPLKNMSAFSDKNGHLKPLVYDFDVATMVTGYDNLGAWQAKPEFGLTERSYAFTYKHLLKLRTEFDRKDLEQGLNYFLQRFTELEKVIELAEVDTEGRSVARKHIEHFRKAAEEIFDPNLKFIADSKVGFYDLPTGKKNKLEPIFTTQSRAFLRLGTPFKILEESGAYLKIVILDLNYDLKSGSGSVGYIKNDSQFGSEVLQGNLPFKDDRDFF